MKRSITTLRYMGHRFSERFFRRPTLEVAQRLLGARLTTVRRNAVTSGVIVEVEAYCAEDDEACHASRGQTGRNEVMFWEGGHCYVYLIYGMYYCVNVVTEAAGRGSAVLIRALQPIEGIEHMHRRRSTLRELDLTSGPGKICEALAIDRDMLGEHLLTSPLIRLDPYLRIAAHQIVRSPRIGISKGIEHHWRYFLKDNPWVSRARLGPTAKMSAMKPLNKCR